MYLSDITEDDDDEEKNETYEEIEENKAHPDMSRENDYTIVLDYKQGKSGVDSPEDFLGGYSGNVIYKEVVLERNSKKSFI